MKLGVRLGAVGTLALVGSLSWLGVTAYSAESIAIPKDRRVGVGGICYDGTLEDAQAEAAGRNVPILILAVLDGEGESVLFRTNFLADGAVTAAAEEAIVLIVDSGDHTKVPVTREDADGNKQKIAVCPYYEVTDCEIHRRNWTPVYNEYTAKHAFVPAGNDGAEWKLPEALIIRPDGMLVDRLNQGNPPAMGNVIAALQKARDDAGEGLTLETWQSLVRLSNEGSQKLQAKAWSEAWHRFNRILAVTGKGPYAEQARASMPIAMKEMETQLRKAEAYLEPRFAEHAYRTLHQLSKDFAGSPLEKRVKAAIKKAETDAELKAIVLPLKVELAAEDLLEAARAFKRDGDKKGARKSLIRLFHSRYAKTEAVKTAREEFPDAYRRYAGR